MAVVSVEASTARIEVSSREMSEMLLGRAQEVATVLRDRGVYRQAREVYEHNPKHRFAVADLTEGLPVDADGRRDLYVTRLGPNALLRNASAGGGELRFEAVPDAGGAAGADQECPGWYAPASRVHGFESEGATVTVTIERGLVEQLRAEPGALYACDDARYVAREEGWVFEGIDPGDLLFELGIREGDRGAVVQGFDPRTGKVTSTGYALTSIKGMQQAYAGLREADGVRVVVERAAGDGGAREVWISIL